MNRDAQILSQQSLIRPIAMRVWQHIYGAIPLDDLIQYGEIGLIKAVDHYNHDKHASLSTYARQRIFGEIMDSVRNEDMVPRQERVRMAILGLRREMLSDLLANHNAKISIVDTKPRPYELASKAERLAHVLKVCNTLSPRYRYVIIEHFWKERTHKAIGLDLHVGESRVSQMITRACIQLRKRL